MPETCSETVLVMTTPTMKAKLKQLAKDGDTSQSKLGHKAFLAAYGDKEATQ